MITYPIKARSRLHAAVMNEILARQPQIRSRVQIIQIIRNLCTPNEATA